MEYTFIMQKPDDLELLQEDEENEYSDEALGKIVNQVDQWYEAFTHNVAFQELTEEQKENSGFIVRTFAE